MKKKPAIEVTGFWMRTVPFTSSGDVVRDQGSELQAVEVLVEHNGKWITIFGPKGAGECAYVNAQNIDNMIHPGGINNLVDHGEIHPPAQTSFCASCGNPEKPHRFRHRFVRWTPGMPEPKRSR